MRTAIAVTAFAAALGFGAGWVAHGGPHEVVRTVYKRAAPSPKPILVAKAELLPEYPKPPLDPPVATPMVSSASPSNGQPEPLSGNLPQLPSPEGAIGPMVPDAPAKLPAEDLNADEALARRIVDGLGGEVVSSADAKDATGKVGRALVAETGAGGLERLRAALRKALGDRAVLNDGGAGGGSSPETRKAEDALAELKRKRDRARIDFLPQSPTLRDLEEATLKGERALAELRRTASRQRLNILLRPTLT